MAKGDDKITLLLQILSKFFKLRPQFQNGLIDNGIFRFKSWQILMKTNEECLRRFVFTEEVLEIRDDRLMHFDEEERKILAVMTTTTFKGDMTSKGLHP